jgi:hypothetical protein
MEAGKMGWKRYVWIGSNDFLFAQTMNAPGCKIQSTPRLAKLLLSSLVIVFSTHADAFISPSRLTTQTCKTLLQNKYATNEYSDFDSHDSVDEELEAQQLTREFYEEVRLRKSRSYSSIDEVDSNEMYEVKNQLTATDDDSPLFAFLSFLKPSPPPSSSAGLFSGRGQTAHSSGRSQRAEVQLLESTHNNKNGARIIGWDGIIIDSKPDQLERILKAAAGTLVVLSVAYLAMELTGGLTIVFPWEEAVAAGIAKEGISSVLIVLSDGVEHVGSLVFEESSAFVGSMGPLVHSIEELMLR